MFGSKRTSAQVSELAVCPPCSSDGGYGSAQPDVEYQCPHCRIEWSYNQRQAKSKGRPRRGLLAELEGLKVWLTSDR